MSQYNWEDVLEEARRITGDGDPSWTSWTELADSMNMPRQTLAQGLMREHGVRDIGDLGAVHAQVPDIPPAESVIERLERLIQPMQTPSIPSVQNLVPAVNVDAAVFLLSDLHYGASFEGDELFTPYNSGIADSWLRRYFAWVRSEVTKGEINEVHIMNLGDMVDGTHLRIQHARETDMHLVDQVVSVTNILCDELWKLACVVPELHVWSVPGNHTRIQQKVGSGHPAESMDLMISRFVAKYLEDSHITFHIAKDWYALGEVAGHGVLLIHGDEVRGNSNPGKKISERVQQYQKLVNHSRRGGNADVRDIEYAFCGHYHRQGTYTDVDTKIYMNGSFQPSSEFVGRAIGTISVPSQTGLLFQRDVGVVSEITCFLNNVD